MPTYQYSCTECGHAFEQFQSFTDDALTVCPVCQGRLRKVFNAVGVVFKGSGFYRTDSRSGSGEKSEKSEAKSDTEKTSGSNGSPSEAGAAKKSGASDSGSTKKADSTSSSSSKSTPAPKSGSATS